MHIYSFEKLEVWKEARRFVTWIYELAKAFPSDEKYGLVSQLKRASISIVSNLAEGSARRSLKDQAHFYQLAYSSLIEVLNQLIISHDLGFVRIEKLQEGRALIDSLANKTGALRKSQLQQSVNPKP